MKLPTGWKRIAAGHYLHGETHTEIMNTWGGKPSAWRVCIPPRRSVVIAEGADGRCTVIHDCKTLAEAITKAEETVLPRTRQILAEAWDAAIWDRTGTPEQWTEGQVDDKIVYARHDAVQLSGRRTGRDAQPGDLFKHIELGTVLAFDRIENDTLLYVREVLETEAYPVHPNDVVVIECPDILEAKRALEDAYAESIEAAATAVAIGRPSPSLVQRSAYADLEVARATLRLKLAVGMTPGLYRIVTMHTSRDDGSTWPLVGFTTQRTTSPAETETDQAWRYAVALGNADSGRPCRVRVYAHPDDVDPAGEWTNFTDPCGPGQHDTGHHPQRRGDARPDGSVVEVSRCAGCFHPVWRATADGAAPTAWTLEGDDLPAVSQPDGGTPTGPPRGPAGTGTPTAGTRAPGPVAVPPGPAAIRFRVHARTATGWRVVRTGTTPPQFEATPGGLDVVADTVLSNARQVLGLGPDSPLPTVRVQAWDRRSGLTRTVVKDR